MDEQHRVRDSSTVMLRSAPVIGVAVLLFVSGHLILDYIPRFGMPPCVGPDWLFHPLRALVAILIIGGFYYQVWLFRTPSPKRLTVALIVPLFALGVQTLASEHEKKRQSRCEALTLDEAIIVCRVDRSHYRISKSEIGTDVLTLMSPGTTDAAWRCLERWAVRQNAISLEVDESVYGTRVQ